MSDLKPLIRIYIIQYVSTQPLYKSGSLYAFLPHAMINILVYHAKTSTVYLNREKTISLFLSSQRKIIIYFYKLSLVNYNFTISYLIYYIFYTYFLYCLYVFFIFFV